MHPDWIRAHESLKETMVKEIGLMREMLSNLYLEETVLLGKDRQAWSSLMQERGHMIAELKKFRLGRDLAVKTLSELSLEEEIDESTLATLLGNEQDLCEISFMLDQLVALTDKVNQQNSRNHALLDSKDVFSLDLSPYPCWGVPSVPMKKLALMTLHRKLAQEEDE